MIREDFLLRLLARIAETIARAMGLQKRGRTEEAQQLLDEALASHVGMSRPMLDRLSPEEIARLLGPEKAMVVAAILDAEADPARAEQARARAAAVRRAAGLPVD